MHPVKDERWVCSCRAHWTSTRKQRAAQPTSTHRTHNTVMLTLSCTQTTFRRQFVHLRFAQKLGDPIQFAQFKNYHELSSPPYGCVCTHTQSTAVLHPNLHFQSSCCAHWINSKRVNALFINHRLNRSNWNEGFPYWYWNNIMLYYDSWKKVNSIIFFIWKAFYFLLHLFLRCAA